MTVTRPRAVLAVMTAVLLLAVLLRIPDIDGPSLWTDEGFTYYTFTVDLFEALRGDRHPPFYFVTLHGWEALTGDSVLALRWWSLLPAMLTVAVAYQLGGELARARPGIPGAAGVLGVPVLAALLMTLNDGESYMAQELRMYSWQVLFAALSTLTYLRALRRPVRGRFAAYVTMSALLLYTHYFGAFVLAAQGLHALLTLRGRLRMQIVAALAMAGGLFLPWFLGVTLVQFSVEEVCVNCASASNWETLLDFRGKWLGAQWPLMLALLVFGVFHRVTPHTPAGDGFPAPHARASVPRGSEAPETRAKGPASPGGGLGAKRAKVRGAYEKSVHRGGRAGGSPRHKTPFADVQHMSQVGSTRSALLLVLLLVVPVAATYMLGHEELVLLARRMVQITVPVVLLMALGAGNLQLPARAVIAAAVLLYGVSTVDWYRVKAPWEAMTARVAQYADPGELALAEVAFEEAALRYYYDHLLPPGMQISTYPVWGDTPRFDYYEVALPALLNAQDDIQSGPVQTAWVVYFSTDTGLLDKLAAAGFTRTMSWPYDHVGSTIDVFRYDRLPDMTIATFANGMTLRAVETPLASGHVDLWWTADSALSGEIVTSLLLLDPAGNVAATRDSVPFAGRRPIAGWQPGETVYDPKPLPDDLAPGTYTLAVQVYRFVDGAPVNIPVEGAPWIEVGTVTLGES